MQFGRLIPAVRTISGATTTMAKILFAGFQRMLDFTASGTEASTSMTVVGEADMEYRVLIRNLNAAQQIYVRINNDSGGSSYGYQFLRNSAGSLSAGRGAQSVFSAATTLGWSHTFIFIPSTSTLMKVNINDRCSYNSGTAIGVYDCFSSNYPSTASTVSLDFLSGSGNFTAGTRIVVYGRRASA